MRHICACFLLCVSCGPSSDSMVSLWFSKRRHWKAWLLQTYANERGIKIVGDMPIYVGGQSADVWANPTLFALGPDRHPEMVSGVPPDAFSETGQLWGSPLYDWKAHDAEGYRWWAQRLGRAAEVLDSTESCSVNALLGHPENLFIPYWKVLIEWEYTKKRAHRLDLAAKVPSPVNTV